MKLGEQCWQVEREVKVHAAKAGIVKTVQEIRSVLLHESHHHLRLCGRRREMERLIVNWKPPLYLLILRGAVVVQCIFKRRKGTFEPTLVQRETVGIRGLHD